MPIVITPEGRLLGDVHADIAKLEKLAADLRHIARGDMPSDQSIAAAPFINEWSMSVRSSHCLVGRMDKVVSHRVV
jgi:hypothetical protein